MRKQLEEVSYEKNSSCYYFCGLNNVICRVFMADAGKMMFISTMAGIFFIVIVIGLTVLAIRKKMENPHVVYTENADISDDYNQEN